MFRRVLTTVKNQKPLLVNSTMFAGFLTLGDYLALRLEERLDGKPQHHPVHRSEIALPASAALIDLSNQLHHYHNHRHSEKIVGMKSSTTHITEHVADSNSVATGIDDDDNDEQELEMFEKMKCVFKSGLVVGTFQHWWYVLLDSRLHGATGKVIALKVFLDQLVASNLTNIGFFLTCGLFEGKTPQQCANEIGSKYLFLYMFDIAFWVPAQAINFKYVPAKYRVAFVSFVQVFWNMFMCYHRVSLINVQILNKFANNFFPYVFQNNDIQTMLLPPGTVVDGEEEINAC